jgi:hypothetical protein
MRGRWRAWRAPQRYGYKGAYICMRASRASEIIYIYIYIYIYLLHAPQRYALQRCLYMHASLTRDFFFFREFFFMWCPLFNDARVRYLLQRCCSSAALLQLCNRAETRLPICTHIHARVRYLLQRCLYMHECMYVCMYSSSSISIYLSIYKYIYIHTHTFKYIHIYIYIYTLRLQLHIYILYMHVCMYLCICMYVCTYRQPCLSSVAELQQSFRAATELQQS